MQKIINKVIKNKKTNKNISYNLTFPIGIEIYPVYYF